MWQSRLESQCYVAILVLKTMQTKIFISIWLWALSDIMLDFLQHVVRLKGCFWWTEKLRFAQRCQCSGRVLAAHCWTLILLSMSQMTKRKYVVSYPFTFITKTSMFSSRHSIRCLAYNYSPPKHSHQRDTKSSTPRQRLPKEGVVYSIPSELDSRFWSETSLNGAKDAVFHLSIVCSKL